MSFGFVPIFNYYIPPTRALNLYSDIRHEIWHRKLTGSFNEKTIYGWCSHCDRYFNTGIDFQDDYCPKCLRKYKVKG